VVPAHPHPLLHIWRQGHVTTASVRRPLARQTPYLKDNTYNRLLIMFRIYMLVPKRANCQYRYGAVHYRYWYPYSNLLVFTFLSAFFQSTIEFISIGSEYLPLLVMDRANTGTGTWNVPILEKNATATMPILVRALGHSASCVCTSASGSPD